MTILVNTPDVLHESFDSETVIVNLRAGIYFSLNEAGKPLWERIGKGTTEAELADFWQKTYGTSEEDARIVIRAFLKELHQEQLVVIEMTGTLEAPVESLPATPLRPALQKFTDLQDLLMIDPIHEVDERGWPHAKPVGDAMPKT